jgi:uncharacterized membrane protein
MIWLAVDTMCVVFMLAMGVGAGYEKKYWDAAIYVILALLLVCWGYYTYTP